MLSKSNTGRLRREVSRNGLLLYGLGNIIGAGIYVLVGKIAERSGYLAPLSFLVAAVAASLTAFSYSELAKILAVTAAEPVYAFKAFKKRWLSAGIGFALFGAAIVSAAVLAISFTGYFRELVDLPDVIILSGILMVMVFIALRGIKETVRTAATLTIIEVTGLLLIVISAFVLNDGFGSQFMGTLGKIPDLFSPDAFGVVLSGSFLAFYAFIGFEDMMGLAEEVKDPKRSYPYAILGSITIAVILYVLVTVVAMTVLSPNELGTSSAPLADVYQKATGWPPIVLAFIGLAAITNGLLAHMVMGSRMLYGLSKQGWAVKELQEVTHHGTPGKGTVLVALSIALAAWTVPLERLAELTSLLLLTVFIVVNLSLIVLRRQSRIRQAWYKRAAPWGGIAVTLLMVATRIFLAS